MLQSIILPLLHEFGTFACARQKSCRQRLNFLQPLPIRICLLTQGSFFYTARAGTLSLRAAHTTHQQPGTGYEPLHTLLQSIRTAFIRTRTLKEASLFVFRDARREPAFRSWGASRNRAGQTQTRLICTGCR
jgi:hypothetical protein